MKTVLITGASRGIGLGLVRQFRSAGYRVIPTARNPDNATALNQLCNELGADQPMKLDVGSDESIAQLAKQLKESSVKIDILVNNAGIANPGHPVDPPHAINRSDMLSIFNTNVAGVAKVTEMVGVLDTPNSIVVNVSSLMGSVTLAKTTALGTSYRCSKAALNMLTRCYSLEWPRTTFIMIHPGWVQTDMGSSGGRTADISVDESVEGIVKVVSGLTNADTGKFFDWKGDELPF